ncbi:trifunctional serine/threonine-protein kinase/ATP-binding protein/sensor histidine kinase [Roseofilum casamattae]|uniref:histidine kinase n=1 Tax=Roseofilum casamattae BLCC-M143 TaxID=3022442 RepID=A0ABT7BZL7_9CYAN|nr:AAA family ATPase [Roseofilum casamattae]MDJ1184652.1 AAA family ATPase [Roseofilum casamattae BLCC-M143]
MKKLLNFPRIQNYQIEEIIHESDRTLVYRARHEETGQPAIVKLMRNEYPSFSELVQFRNQYAIAKNLDIPGIVKPYSLERYQNGYALIMEDMGSISLSEYQQQFSLSLSEFLQIAVQLTKILHELHQNQIIHKDIKPANILIHPETKDIKLIDFSISSLLPKETQSLQTPNVLEGTLPYLSPEQTGRMNRGIDYRSDFYSLGVTFYELLAGKRPFESEDPLELVHAHIAKKPPTIPEIEVPKPVADIAVKLMSKNAEDRYQSALGLKYDLEHCRTQWYANQTIERFQLGIEDRSDRFLIPEKLYGRETEVQSLLDAFERVSHGRTEMMLVAGFSGIGKTAVVNEVHKPITRQKGYFIKGKFDQFNRNIPFSAFVQAFRDLMGQLLGESDRQLQQWKEKILEAVGENGQVLIEVIPELEKIIGEQPPIPELSGNAAQNRFNLLFEKFIAIFTTKEHPLTVFLDDLQWADSASLNLLKVLMGDNRTGYLLFLGAYRDNEVYPAHPLILSLADLEQQKTTITTITLTPLSVAHLNQLVAETLSCSVELAAPLTDLVHQKTKGNPFFTTQFLKGLYEDNSILFNLKLGYWECDLVRVRDAALTDDVVEFMAGRLHKLPEETQNLQKLAACIGNQFDLETLAIICEIPSEEVAVALWSALREGFILPQSEAYKFFQGWEQHRDGENVEGIAVGYRFLHDRVQQAAYILIPEDEQKRTHLKIGRSLLINYQDSQYEDNLFDIVNQLNIGRELISDRIERKNLAQLNLQAGRKAKASTAYGGALEYLKTGLELLGVEGWETDSDLTLALYTEAIEASYLNAEFEQAEQYSERVLENVSNILDTAKIYELKINQRIAEQKADEAVEIGLQVLSLLGISREQILDYGRQEIILPQLEDLANAPEMTDRDRLASMGLLISIVSGSTIAQPDLLLPSIMTQIHLSLQGGNCKNTAFAYSWYGSLCCGYLGEIEKGYQSGQIALALLEQFAATSIQCQVMTMVYLFVYPWKKSIREVLPLAFRSFQVGQETGDVLYGSYSIFNYCVYLFLSGERLDDVVKQHTFYIEVLEQQRIDYSASLIRFWKYLSLKLQDASTTEIDEIYQSIISTIDEVGAWGFYALNLAEGMLSYLGAEYDRSVVQLQQAIEYGPAVGGWPPIGIHNFYYSLALLAVSASADDRDRANYLKQVETNQEKMTIWARNAPMNYQHKYDLVEAEHYRILGNKIEAIEFYDRAIAGAKENEYIQEEALANELAAQFYLDWGKEKIAKVYMEEAYYGYAQWGAKAKTNALEQHYPELLTAILTPNQPNSPFQNPLTSWQEKTMSSMTSEGGIMLDLGAIVKTFRTLSETIELDRAIANLMQVIQENAGAETLALFLFHEETLMLEAKMTDDILDRPELIPADRCGDLPLTIINTVKRTHQPLVLDDACNEPAYSRDTCIQTRQLHSILCLPLQDRGRVVGLLYLENNHAIGAFTSDRVEVLSLLCAQAAITLENARLYQQAQQSLQLERDLHELQRTQLTLIQSEKMFSLGRMVGGIAHEINNPVTFIYGNINHANAYMHDILRLLELYQQHYPQPVLEIQDIIEDIDLDFVQKDFQQLLTSMKSGSDRIKKIVTSLRTFSRLDESEFKAVNLHEGIDSTLTILQSSLPATEKRREIQILKDYGDLPRVGCYAGQLNQVFLNILNNAIDALEEYEGQEFPLISISTKSDGSNVTIAIADNGTGMTEDTQKRLFDPFFTTKPVGKGTGLGMAIAYQIIAEQHEGTISCQSELSKGTKFIISLPVATIK